MCSSKSCANPTRPSWLYRRRQSRNFIWICATPTTSLRRKRHLVFMKPQMFVRFIVSLLVLLVLFSFMLGFQVRQNEQVVLTRFGSPTRVIQKPGLYAKWPWPIEKVNHFDARLNFYEIRLSEALTKDKRNVIVPVFVAWRIVNPQRFLEAIGSTENAQAKLDSLVSSAKNTVLGNYDFGQLVSVKPEDVKLSEIEQ